MQPSYLLTILIFLPAAGAAALLVLGSDDRLWIRLAALVTAIVEFLLSLLLVRGFSASATTYQFEEFRAWIPAPADSLPPGPRRYQPFSCPADDVSNADGHAGVLEIGRESHAGLLHRAAGARNRHDRRLPFTGSVSLFPFLGGHAAPNVLPDRHLGPRAPHLRRAEVYFVHDGRIDSDVCRYGLAVRADRDVRPAPYPGVAYDRPGHVDVWHGASSVRRVLPGIRDQGAAYSRYIPGCPMHTPRRPPQVRCCWPESC